MANIYITEAYRLLSNVTFDGVEGAAASALQWSGTGGGVTSPQGLTDFDEQGDLDAGVDQCASSSYTFSGYTITIGSAEYPIFVSDFSPNNYYLIGTTDAINALPSSGTSNVFQQAVSPVYLCFAEG